MSAPPGPRNGPLQSIPPSRTNSRAGTPQPSTRSGPSTVSQLGLGPRPQLDPKRVEELLKLDTGVSVSLSRYLEQWYMSLSRSVDTLTLGET